MTKEERAIEAITDGLFATETAVEAIQNAEVHRREAAIELRELRLLGHENLQKLKEMLTDLEEQVDRERVGNTKWMDRRMDHAKAMADEALSSTLMVKDVQTLEKKVSILRESVIQVNKSYKDYSESLNMDELQDQVIEMVHRVERQEREALNGFDSKDEQSLERVFRGAIEGLYGMRSTNPKVMAEAKKLAKDLAIYRDAAANKNFYAMISSPKGIKKSAESVSASSSESKFATDTSSGATTNSTLSPWSDHDSAVSSSQYSSGNSMPKQKMPKKKTK